MKRALLLLALAACRTAGAAAPPTTPDPAPTATARIAPVSLQKAYNGGRTIDGVAGPVEVSGQGITSTDYKLAGDPTAAQLMWLTIGADKVVQLFNAAGKVFISATGSALVTGDEGARLNSKNGAAEVVGRTVSIIAQNGEVSIDATTVVTLGAILLRGGTTDPPLEGPGQVWYRTDLKKIRYYDGTSVKTLATSP